MGSDPSSKDQPGPPALQAPWRLAYLEALGEAEQQAAAPSTGSFLRDDWLDPAHDAAHLIVVRDDSGMILLNRYPYANGHLLVALGEGRPGLMDYEPAQRAHLWSLVEVAMDMMERTLACQGVNVGINQGRAAGAGVPGHLHVHLVPRWGGDVNFITTVGQVRVMPASLEAMYERYAAAWRVMCAGGLPESG